MHLHKPRTLRGVFKMQRNCLDQVGPQLIPAISFGENTVAKCASVEAAFLRIANLEDLAPRGQHTRTGRAVEGHYRCAVAGAAHNNAKEAIREAVPADPKDVFHSAGLSCVHRLWPGIRGNGAEEQSSEKIFCIGYAIRRRRSPSSEPAAAYGHPHRPGNTAICNLINP